LSAFPADVAARFRMARTVAVETSAAPGAPVHRAIIWIVADETGRAFVRSHRGRLGRWYRELVMNPVGAVLVNGRRVAVRARPADAEGIETCSRLLAEKHAGARGSLTSMLRDEILDATLELEPA
jgi:hypothetical protein